MCSGERDHATRPIPLATGMHVLVGRIGDGTGKTWTVIVDVRAAGDVVATVRLRSPDRLEVVVDGDGHCSTGRRWGVSDWTQLTAAGTELHGVTTAPYARKHIHYATTHIQTVVAFHHINVDRKIEYTKAHIVRIKRVTKWQSQRRTTTEYYNINLRVPVFLRFCHHCVTSSDTVRTD